MRDDEHPLSEADFAAVRTAVLERIHRRPVWLPRLAFAAVAIVILAVTSHFTKPAPLPQVPPRLPEVALATPLSQTPELTTSGGQAAPPVQVKATKKRQARAPVLYMHIQTADPDIRIIWIAQQEGP